MFQFIRTVLIGVLVSFLNTGYAMDLDFKDNNPLKDAYWMSGFLSRHFGTDQKYNENNPGLGVLLNNGWGGGMYKNSLNKNSLYIIKELEKELARVGDAKLNGTLDLGAVTGYKKGLTPLVLPGLGLDYQGNRLQLGVVPPIPGVTPATLALQFRKKF